ncbi:bifunctional GNAT family N-acetyltransferase/carbon-nitrogen hydrolase family protein [Chiayiivirga flava]|uniref:Putative amidohydrolase/ribosomal protein S18 acetylase RimI-like enzyme n=1 Tax=Chiayiivirga flava TaxID=659595 RepID=A0A7W8D763_9GAMM|nr:bifunctional GNAT family N-acetyltransferase/carbon-nitrogen hydrolase family protein [Chiayiivirga flava]MBB5209201.1 putative amidohydrolase/ribosomal protein S18 acetylase RimI-like enzyme [Chiayiivirga flava]
MAIAADKARLAVREATADDIPAIVALSTRVYGEDNGYTQEMLRGQLTQFPQGQFVALYDGRVVGYCATFRASEALVMAPHTWRSITGGGYASRHEAAGDWLYGMEVCVDTAYRGLRIGRRLYDRRKQLCVNLGLRGIVFGGRLPGLARRMKRVGSAQAYVEAVRGGHLRDATLGFQLRNGFEPVGVLEGYLPYDTESLGYAAHMVWRNPKHADHPLVASVQHGGRFHERVRVATVQYQQRRVADFDGFATQVEYFVDVAADYSADFVVFPELFTLQLLSVENAPLSPADSIRSLTGYTQRFCELLTTLALRYNINIIGGSHPTVMDDGDIHNNCYVALRDGSLHVREKLHPTPNERHWWRITGGDSAQVIETDCGPIGIMICYDSEFPELGRHLTDQGALLLFVPFCTDTREGYLRVRYSSQARAIENQSYVVLSGNCGNLPGVNNFDIQYSQSCILTPCDFPFARDGVAADTTPNAEMVAFADLRLDTLIEARANGTVQNLKDRRHDLYSVQWRRKR